MVFPHTKPRVRACYRQATHTPRATRQQASRQGWPYYTRDSRAAWETVV